MNIWMRWPDLTRSTAPLCAELHARVRCTTRARLLPDIMIEPARPVVVDVRGAGVSGFAWVLAGVALWPAASLCLGVLIGRAVRAKARCVQVQPASGGPLQRTWLS
jgi:hypothetical protein